MNFVMFYQLNDFSNIPIIRIGLYKSILVTILFCANVCWSLGRASALLGMRMLC